MTYMLFISQEMYSLADRIGLRVPDIDTFVENLNSNGYLLKKGPKTYQVIQCFSFLNFRAFYHKVIVTCKLQRLMVDPSTKLHQI